MPTSSRFAVAVHILTLLAQSAGEPVTSEHIAGSVNTHPAVIRRVLMALARAGLTTTQFGAGGGALLARAPEAISLLDVYRAVEDGVVFGTPREAPNPTCRVGRRVRGALDRRTAAATRALEAELARDTVADVLADVTHDAGHEHRDQHRRTAGPAHVG